ncbi:hypothetical protein FKM82_028135 [Ascaphus truei]
MRAALALIPSVLLLLVGGLLWSKRGAPPTVHPSHRVRRAQTPRTDGDLPAHISFATEDHPPTGTSRTEHNIAAKTDVPLEQGIFWSQALERALPEAFPEQEVQRWQESARSARVVSLERGCGRSVNRLATLSDGSRACVRYGINPEQIQGEALSFYLSRLLGLRGVPPCVLSKVGSAQWGPVQSELGATGWAPGALLSLTPWVHNLSAVLPPRSLRAEDGRLRPLREELTQLPGRAGLLDLAQWGELILFDYLTANFDRLVSNLFSLQWDRRIMLRGTSNLQRAPGGALVLLDNEAGLAHGYRLRDTWDKYNEQLLGAVCLFRRGAVRALRELHAGRSAARELHALYGRAEPLSAELGPLSEAQAQILQERVGRAYGHVMSCQDRYS